MNKPTTLCDRCKIAFSCLLDYDGIPCRKNRTVEPTNYDLLISKSPEELADAFAGGCPNGDRLNCRKYYKNGGRDCFACWLDWLKSPVEVDNGT